MVETTLTLDTSDQNFKKVLETAYYQKGDEESGYIAVVREVLRLGPGKEKVIFELLSLQEKPSFWYRWFLATRAKSLFITIGPFLALLSYGFLTSQILYLPLAFCALSGALCLQIAVNLFNDVSDYKKLIDIAGSSRGSGVLHKGWLAMQDLRKAGYLALVIGILFGIPILLQNPIPVLILGCLGIFGTFFYSQEGFGLKYLGLGDFTIFGLLGPCLIAGYSFALFQKIIPLTYWLGALFGIACWAILTANNLQNLPFDINRKAKTLPTLLGFNRSRFLLALLYFFLFAIFVVASFLKRIEPFLLLCLVPCAPLAWKSIQNSFQASGPNSPLLNNLKTQTALFHFIFSISFSLTCLILFWIRS